MEERITLKEWIENFNNGDYKEKDFDTQVKAGWYDWFCKDTSLAGKTNKMGNIIKKINNEYLLNKCYVFFKNNCPVVGPLYDDFRFCKIENDGDSRVLYTISIGDRRNNCKYTIYGRENDFRSPLFETNMVKGIINFLNNIKEI